jgi:hypothetical protein
MARVNPKVTGSIRNIQSASRKSVSVSVVGAPQEQRGLTKNRIAKNATSLVYPQLGAGQLGDGGHCIVFKINETISAGRLKRNGIPVTPSAPAAGGEFLPQRNGATVSRPPNTATGGAEQSALLKATASSRRLSQAIVLYMPPQVQTTYGINYTDVDMGFASQAMGGVFDYFRASANEMKEQKNYVSEEKMNAFVKGMSMTTLNAVAPGVKAGLQIRSGAIISNKMELSFQGVNRREFQFVFNFTPKSKEEAEEIRKIVKAFKFHSHPAFIKGSGGNAMTFPDTFDIEYLSGGSQNQYIHKISTCFCTNINVQYGGDRYTAHTKQADGSPPTKTILTMSFKELELITKDRIKDGY